MNHLERFYATVERRPVDRPACWLGFPVEAAYSNLFSHFNVNSIFELKQKLDDDIFAIDIPYHSPDANQVCSALHFAKRNSDNWEDKTLTAPGFFEDYDDPAAINDFDWPDPSRYIDPDECRKAVAQVPEGYALMCASWSPHFQDACAAFGMETALVKMMLEPEMFMAVIDRITEFYLKANEVFYDAVGNKIHAVLIGNDFGSQTGLLIAPQQLREFVLPGTRRLVQQAKERGYKVFHHSCGAIFEIIPDLIEAGVDVIHPIQALAKGMAPDLLKNAYGDKVSFCGGVDAQNLLVNGTPEQVREKVEELCRIFPTGLVISPSHEAILPDTKTENIASLFNTVRSLKTSDRRKKMKNEIKCFYVAPNGCDHWSGLLKDPNELKSDGPFGTLRKAVEAARSIQGEPRKIILRGGDYFDVSVDFSAQDSGLIVEAMKGETPRLYGGKRITGWLKEKDSDFWYAELPEALSGEWDFRLLTVDGKLCTRSKLPENGTFRHETEFDVEWLSTSAGGWARKPSFEELTTLKYKDGDLGPWLDIQNAEMTVYHRWDESMVGIASHDVANQTLRFSNPCGHPPGGFKAYDYVVWNTREGMTVPGRWYLDRTAGRVVYWPRTDEDIQKSEVIAPTGMHILNFIENVEGMTIKGLELSVTNTPLIAAEFAAFLMPGAIHSHKGIHDCRFEKLKITNTGGHGMKFLGNSRSVTITECEISHTGAGGILFRDNTTEEPITVPEMMDHRLESTISNNFIHHIGTVSESAIAISVGCSEVVHNEISDVPYSGICVGGFSGHRYGGRHARIEYNLLSRAMQVLHDGAAIYTTFNKDGIMRRNVIKDIQQSNDGKSIKSALYLDELSEGWTMEENLVINCNHPTLNHMSARNFIRNNLFVCDTYLQVNIIRCKEYTVERNVLYSKEKVIFEGNPEAITDFSNNLIFSGAGEYEERHLNEKYEHYDTIPLRVRDNSMTADPLFDDVAAGNFILSDRSSAFGLGIINIDVSKAGRIKP